MPPASFPFFLLVGGLRRRSRSFSHLLGWLVVSRRLNDDDMNIKVVFWWHMRSIADICYVMTAGNWPNHLDSKDKQSLAENLARIRRQTLILSVDHNMDLLLPAWHAADYFNFSQQNFKKKSLLWRQQFKFSRKIVQKSKVVKTKTQKKFYRFFKKQSG